MPPSEIYNIPIQSFVSLFDFLHYDTNFIFWMRSADYKKQLFVSQSFADVWGLPVTILYDHPEVFNEHIIKTDKPSIDKMTNGRKVNPYDLDNKPYNYRIVTNNGAIRSIYDQAMPVFNNRGRQVAIAGVAADITNYDQESSRNAVFPNIIQEKINTLTKDINTALKQLKLTLQYPDQETIPHIMPGMYLINGQKVKVTQRQADCLNHSFQGKSAKEIGRDLGISYRTVEEHFDILRDNSNAHSKLDLIIKFLQQVLQ